MNNILNEIQGMSKFPIVSDFLEAYEGAEIESVFGGNSRLDYVKVAAHVRILSQVEYTLRPEKSWNLNDIGPKANNLEHIFPMSNGKWRKDKKYKKMLAKFNL